MRLGEGWGRGLTLLDGTGSVAPLALVTQIARRVAILKRGVRVAPCKARPALITGVLTHLRWEGEEGQEEGDQEAHHQLNRRKGGRCRVGMRQAGTRMPNAVTNNTQDAISRVGLCSMARRMSMIAGSMGRASLGRGLGEQDETGDNASYRQDSCASRWTLHDGLHGVKGCV